MSHIVIDTFSFIISGTLILSFLIGCSSEEDITILTAPEGLDDRLSEGKVTLVWQNVEGAKYYRIYCSTHLNGDFTEIGSSETNTYNDNNVNRGSTYFYKVAGVSKDGIEGNLSAPHQVDIPGIIEISPSPLILHNDIPENLLIINVSARSVSWELNSNDPWIILGSKNGITNPGQTDYVPISANISSLKIGEFTGNIQVITDDGGKMSVVVRVTKTASIAGKTLNSRSEKIVRNVSISIDGQAIDCIEGDFLIEHNSPGKFQLKAEKPGYIPALSDFEVDEWGNVGPLKVWMRPIPIPVGDIDSPAIGFMSPVDICFSGDGRRAYVSDETGSVFIINTSNDAVIDQKEVGIQPMGIVANPQLDEIYIADAGAHEVILLDGQLRVDKIKVDKYPQQLAISQDGSWLYVTCRDSKTVVKIDTKTRQAINPSFSVGREPYGIALSTDQRTLYVSNYRDNNISILDASTGRKLLNELPVGSRPQHIAISKNYLYVSNSQGDEISVINQSTLKLEKAIKIGNNLLLSDLAVLTEPHGGDVAYVLDQTNNSVRLINVIESVNGTAWEVTNDRIRVNDMPTGIGIHPDLTKIYIVNGGSGNISVLKFE